jgi:probable F420-dependent oxidoreductase
MKFGFNAPTAGPLAAPAELSRLCIAGETLGFDYATFSDHVVIPDAIASRYPYSESGEFAAGAAAARHEQLIEVAYIAAKTHKLRLVTSVMVVPHRPAVLAAKQLATIDVLSGGRLTVGIGAGWCEEEFIALGTPPFAERGAVTDEYIAAFKALWTEEHPSFDGKYTKFDNLIFAHRPVQQPGPPIWVGGESGPALRRTARLGDAWYPIGTNPAFPFDSLKRLEAGMARLRKLTVEAGRDPGAVGVAYRVAKYGAEVPGTASDGERRLFSGGAADILADVRALKALGVGHLDFGVAAETTEGAIVALKGLRDGVLAKV